MKIHVYSPIDWFEKWDWRNADAVGIGGSETSHIEVVRGLADRGYDVTSYSPIPGDCPGEHDGVRWIDADYADSTQPGIWLIYRSPESIDKFTSPDQHLWVVCQDVDYDGQWTDERYERVEKVFGLCEAHCNYLLARHPKLAGKIWKWANGVHTDLIRKMTREGMPLKEPHRVMFASSPDRGLLTAVEIVKRAREWVPTLELHAYYGMDRFDMAAKSGRKDLGRMKTEIEAAMKQPGMHWHDRLPQPELYREWVKAGIWLYPTTFTETSCITSMDAQAMGAVPITNPIWGLAENVHNGVFIVGDPASDPLVRSRYVASLVKMSEPDEQDKIRRDMVPFAQMNHGWARVVDWLEVHILWAMEKIPISVNVILNAQCAFQHRHAEGEIVNLGSHKDSGKLQSRGAVNVDALDIDVTTGKAIPVDVSADVRHLPDSLFGRFDTAILGDILEHMDDDDAVVAIQNAKRCLRNGGKVLITWPVEDMEIRLKDQARQLPKEYLPGIRAYHTKTVTLDDMLRRVERAGMRVETRQPIDYTFITGWGLVCRP